MTVGPERLVELALPLLPALTADERAYLSEYARYLTAPGNRRLAPRPALALGERGDLAAPAIRRTLRGLLLAGAA